MKEVTQELLSLPETAKMLGISRDTIYRLVAKGTLVPVYIPGSTRKRFRRSDVMEIINFQKA